MHSKAILFWVMVIAPMAICCIGGVRTAFLNPAHHDVVADILRESNKPTGNEPTSNEPTSKSATTQTLRDCVSDIDEWSKQVGNEIARESVRFRIRRIEQEVLPELDRIEQELIEDIGTSFGQFESRQRVVDRVRRRWQNELSECKDQLNQLL